MSLEIKHMNQISDMVVQDLSNTQDNIEESLPVNINTETQNAGDNEDPLDESSYGCRE